MCVKRDPQAPTSNASATKLANKTITDIRAKQAERTRESLARFTSFAIRQEPGLLDGSSVHLLSYYFVKFAEKHPKIAMRCLGGGRLQEAIEFANEHMFSKLDTGGDLSAKDVLAFLKNLASPNRYTKNYWQLLVYSLYWEPIGRLERCRVCLKFYLKTRKDQKCCSPKCANLFRVRKWRGRYQESYKQQRDRRAQSAQGGK